VTSLTRRARVIALAIAVVAAAAAGYLWWRNAAQAFRETGRSDPPAAQPAAGAEPFRLPDLSRLDAVVQRQVRDQHATLTKVIGDEASSSGERAEACGVFGKLLLAAEYFHEAEAAFLQAQTLAPADMRWPYYLGHVYRARQEPARSIPMFERALALAPDDVPSLVWLGDLHLASGDAAAAEVPLQRAYALQPRSAAALSRLGRVALARRDFPKAVEYLERALEVNPAATSVHYPLGMAYRGLGEAAKAEAHVKQAGDVGGVAPVDPLMDSLTGLLRGAGAFEARGMDALEARDWKAAVDNLRQAVTLMPTNAVTRLNLGTALSLAGDVRAARGELNEAVRLDPTLAKAHFGLGLLAQDEGNWREAIDRFTSAVTHEAGFVDARFTLAEALRRTGQADKAVAHYAEALRLNPAASQARFGHAMALVRLRRWAEARAVLSDAVRIHPEQPGFAHALARILATAPDAPVRDGRRALMLMEPLLAAPPSASVSETMAMVLAELGRFDEAVDWQRRAIAAATSAGQSGVAAGMQDNLARYRQRQPCRTPWRDDDPVIATVAQPR
jgi:tetratricopeptide (TPR) repeat protein